VQDELSLAYERCRRLHRQHGRTYYLATRLLPAWKRRHVHALYGFTRYADEIVDRTADRAVPERERLLRDWSDRFLAGLHGEAVDDPLLPAVLHTVAVFGLEHRDFEVFLESMAMDLTVTGYDRYADLLSYMEGSAAAIGTMMLPILQSGDPAAAREPARQLGIAFQLTNFIRDVAEDLARGRVYLPKEDLDRFGVTRADLERAAAAGEASPALRALVEFEVQRAWSHYALAAPGISMLARGSQACIRAAFHLYSGILREVEAAGCDVFGGRARVPTWQRFGVVARCVLTWPGTPVLSGR
jgi:phytoene synthase